MTPHPAPASFRLRPAEPRDVPAIVGLVHELADYERLGHLVQATAGKLHPHLFGDRPAAQAMVAEAETMAGGSAGDPADGADREVVGFALFFTNFSTFLAQPGLYLEDLYVKPAHRGAGIGRAFLVELAALAVERGCGRFEWSVLDWNEPAIGFYRRMGASLMQDWRICRVAGEALDELAAKRGAAPANR